MERGKVYLVGAGPGDPELMTVKARRLLFQADVVMFDRLISPEMVKDLRGKELIDVGKTAGSHKLSQEEINLLLIEKASAGKIVVRLKGGDPYLFGRGGEEALALLERGIPVEVVPGVTSAIAAPELAGIPVTHRGLASSLTIVTGHEEQGKQSPLDWSALAQLDGTLVVLMGVSRLEKNISALISGGKPPETPAAIVIRGGWPEQRLIVGTLKNIAEMAKEARVSPPAILVVGDVIRLAERLSPQKIAIFRPEAQMLESADLARGYGFKPVCAPSILLKERDLPPDIIKRLHNSQCVVFTSANGVEMALRNEDIKSALRTKMIAAIGPKTKQALESHGLSSAVPEEYSSRGLETLLKERCQKVLFLRSAQASQYLSEELQKAGLEVDDIPLYDVKGSKNAELDQLIENAAEIDVFAFTSSSTAQFLFERADELGKESSLREALAKARVGVIGKPTAEEMRRLGVRVDIMPKQFTFDALLRALRGLA